MQVLPDIKCRFYFTITDNTMCATSVNGSICSGDSGSPLVIVDDSGNMIQIGVSSQVAANFGCEEGFPALFERISYSLDWIEDITGLDRSLKPQMKQFCKYYLKLKIVYCD